MTDRWRGTSCGHFLQKIEEGATSFEELAKYAEEKGEPAHKSGQQELYEMVLNYYQ